MVFTKPLLPCICGDPSQGLIYFFKSTSVSNLRLYLHAYLFTHSLTPWSRVVLEKLTGFQLVKRFLAFYGTRTVISARHLSLSWAFFVALVAPKYQSSSEAYSLTVSQRTFLRWGVVSTSPNPPCRRTTPCRLSSTAYSVYSQLRSILEAVPPSATWGHAMPWWQGPTYHGICCY